VPFKKKTAPEGRLQAVCAKAGLLLNQLDIHGIKAFTTLFELKTDAVVLANLVNQPGCVHEIFGAAVLLPDETKTFGLVEELYYSFIHD
jgi:hypothetical protein